MTLLLSPCPNQIIKLVKSDSLPSSISQLKIAFKCFLKKIPLPATRPQQDCFKCVSELSKMVQEFLAIYKDKMTPQKQLLFLLQLELCSFVFCFVPNLNFHFCLSNCLFTISVCVFYSNAFIAAILINRGLSDFSFHSIFSPSFSSFLSISLALPSFLK